jgi:hypothetical protein
VLIIYRLHLWHRGCGKEASGGSETQHHGSISRWRTTPTNPFSVNRVYEMIYLINVNIVVLDQTAIRLRGCRHSNTRTVVTAPQPHLAKIVVVTHLHYNHQKAAICDIRLMSLR